MPPPTHSSRSNSSHNTITTHTPKSHTTESDIFVIDRDDNDDEMKEQNEIDRVGERIAAAAREEEENVDGVSSLSFQPSSRRPHSSHDMVRPMTAEQRHLKESPQRTRRDEFNTSDD